MQTKINSKISTNPTFEVVKIKTEFNWGAIKTLIVGLLILLQFAILILSGLYLIKLFQWLIVFSVVITVVFCLITLSSNRTGQVKATWILFMLICPFFGWAIFLLSNEKVMFGLHKRKYKKIYERTRFLSNDTDLDSLEPSLKNTCTYLKNSGAFEAYLDTNCKYYPNGFSLFDDILADIAKAQKFILIEFFIISDGVLLNRLLDILKLKAKEGVDIRIIYDDMGSHGTLKRRTKKEIRRAGIKLHTYNKLVPLFNLALNLRDHRKIVVVDGKVAYTGGTNLSDEYIGEKRTHGYWKDEGIRLEGRAVDTLTLSVLRQWEFITGKAPNYNDYLNIAPKSTSTNYVDVVVPYLSGPDYLGSLAKDVYESIISSAQEKIYIMTPYFIPDESTITLLKTKARSGVDVEIVLPEIPDKAFVYLISLDIAERLMEVGVKVHIMKNAFVHSKLVLTENACVVGSINMDQRSFYQQFESAVLTNNKEVMTALNDDFVDTFSKSRLHVKKKLKPIKWCIIHILRLVSPLM